MIRLMHDKFMMGLDGDHINYDEIDDNRFLIINSIVPTMIPN